jgi:iodotyrosine deiodinase
MGFLNEICQRPSNEMAYLLLVVGYPTEDCQVPAITRKPFEDVVVFK